MKQGFIINNLNKTSSPAYFIDFLKFAASKSEVDDRCPAVGVI